MHPDPLWMKAFLTVHVTAGMVSFVLAPVALATAKGGKQHKRWGMVYLWSMGVVSCTALPMALFRPVLFLALVSVISAYLAFSGYRVLRLKNLASGGSLHRFSLVRFSGDHRLAASRSRAAYADRGHRTWSLGYARNRRRHLPFCPKA